LIKNYLENLHNSGKLYNSWLISSDDTLRALTELKEFISPLLGRDILLENHSDFYLVQKQESTKNIAVEQIRQLQNFLYKTSAISGYKIAIIYEADLMNLNSANSCLKILEDTPQNSYIFLITSKAANIIETIKSRCAKLECYNGANQAQHNSIFLLDQEIDFALKAEFINRFLDKDREAWEDFANTCLSLMAKIVKKSVDVDVELVEAEIKIMNQLRFYREAELMQKFEKIHKLVHDTMTYDLDLRANLVLIMDEFASR
jgi:DNA polymerase III subunit delta'